MLASAVSLLESKVSDQGLSSTRKWLSAAFLLFFPFAVLLVVFPALILKNNFAVFRGDAAILQPFLIAAACCAVGSLAAGIAARRSLRALEGMAAIGFWLGLSAVLGDVITRVRTDNLVGFRGNESIVIPPVPLVLLDAAAMVALFWLIWPRRSRGVLTFGPFVAAVLLGASVAPSASLLGDAFRLPRAAAGETSKWVSLPPASVLKDHPNVYHIVLDGFEGNSLPAAMRDAGLAPSDFDGITYFRLNRSNYDQTRVSTPAFLTGSLYRGGAFGAWENSWTTWGIFPRIKEALGTNIQAYSTGAYFQLKRWVQGRRITGGLSLAEDRDLVLHFAVARAAPSFLKPLVFRRGRGVFSGWAAPADSADPRVEPFRLMLADEPSRPARGQYVYCHIYLPHSPYRLDSHCNPSRRADHLSQSACAISLVGQFLNELKSLDHYRDSIIIVQSDHGWNAGAPIEPVWYGGHDQSSLLEGGLREFEPETGRSWRRSLEEIDEWSSALLLVKRSRAAEAPMVTSARSTSLVDLPNTIYDMLGLPQDAPEGKSVFSADYPNSPERHFFTGVRRWDAGQRRQLWLGEDFRQTLLNHYVWQAGQGWRILAPVPASWECGPKGLRDAPSGGFGLVPPAGVKSERTDDRTIRVAWKPDSPVKQYRIELARGNGKFTEIGSADASQGEYHIGSVAPDDSYRVRLRACTCGSDCSRFSEPVTIAPASRPPAAYEPVPVRPADLPTNRVPQAPPLPPSDLTAARIRPRTILLNWRKAAVDHYSVEMARGSGAFSVIGTAAGNTASYTVGDVAADDVYYFRIRACNESGSCSPESNTAKSDRLAH